MRAMNNNSKPVVKRNEIAAPGRNTCQSQSQHATGVHRNLPSASGRTGVIIDYRQAAKRTDRLSGLSHVG